MAKILIELADESYKALLHGCMIPPDVENVVNGIKNGTVLPNNATNGDVIKTMFKSAWDKERTNEEWDEWWNSPYKEVKERMKQSITCTDVN